MTPTGNIKDWIQTLIASRSALRAFLAYPQPTVAKVQQNIRQARQALQHLDEFAKFVAAEGLSPTSLLAVAGDDSLEPFAASVSLSIALRETFEFWQAVVSKAEDRKLDWAQIKAIEKVQLTKLLKTWFSAEEM
ncbi:hypothetical protein Slin14017_G055770 [Septoria linicola]|nr:hypothetical protein Slin14017_G055770 [Septoria linicola]